MTTDPELIFTQEIDRGQAIKQGCIYCAFFLTHGPKVESGS
jgi:hypothetical protein